MVITKSIKTSKRRAAGAQVDPALSPLVDAFSKYRDVTYGGRGFGSGALKVNGRIFAMLSSKRQFVVKLPRSRVDDLVRLGQGDYFDRGRGRLMREWLVLRGATISWLELARQAYRFARDA